MKKRTDADFSKHVVITSESEGLLKHKFAIPGKYMHSIIFLNTNGIMAVTGDYGNWIFCREFHPSAKEDGVSDSYWIQKLKLASTQDPYDFDSKTAQEQIKETLEEHADSLTTEEKDWLEELSDAADDGEYAYIAKAMDRPSNFDTDMIPKGKIVNYWLSVIFDAFDEICHRMKDPDYALMLGKTPMSDDRQNSDIGEPFVPFG